MIRAFWALVLIALEFTHIFDFLAEGPKVPLQNQHSAYSIQFATYGICLLIILIDAQSLRRLVQMRIFRWAFAFLLLLVWSMIIRAYRIPAGIPLYDFVRAFGIQVNAIAFMVASVLVFADPDVLRLTKRAVVLATLFGVALNLYEVFYPGTFSNVPGRSAGLYIDANTSGMALVLGCVIGLTAVPVALREAFVFIVCTGILSTFSREAMLAATILIVGAMMGRALSTARMFAGAMAIGALYFALHLGTLLDQKNVLNSDTLARLSFQTTDSSANSRVRIAEKTFKQFEDAPILGQGFGTTIYWTDIASHDTYLSLMADFGLLGILVIPTLVYSVRRKTWDFYAFAAIFLSWGFFLHLVLYLNYSLISVAIEADESENFRNADFEHSGEAMFFDSVIWER